MWPPFRNGTGFEYCASLRSIIEWKIEFTSEINKGTTLPLYYHWFPQYSNMKKITIEDNKDMRKHSEILELANYTVVTAPNGRVGVELAEKKPWSDYFCDIMMPDLDGYGVLYLLSKKSCHQEFPSSSLTAKAESQICKEFVWGLTTISQNHFEEMELLNAVEAVWGKMKSSKRIQQECRRTQWISAKAKGLEELSKLSSERKVHHLKKKRNDLHGRRWAEWNCVYD